MTHKFKRKAPAFQLYADDFLAGTLDLSQEEVGAYIRLLCHQWSRGSIPVEPEKQQRLAGGLVSDAVLAKFRQCEDNLLRNERLEAEREKQANYRNKQREKGLKSALARAAANRGSTAVATTVQPTIQPDGQPEGNSPSPSPSPTINTYVALAPEAEALKERISVWFKRRPTTPWSSKEIKALKDVIKLGTPPEDIDLLERRYMSGDQYLRREIITLLNNWNGEIDRARGLSRSPQPQLELTKPKRPPGKEWMDDPNDWRHAL
jgi:uncharacterized protein YdaU (DUF1376 family)